MKERKRRRVILFCERQLGESIRRGASELAIAVVVKHFLEICASAGNAIEISIAFAKREVSVRPARTSRIVLEIFLVFRHRQIVEFASEQAVSVIELTLIRSLRFTRWLLRKLFRQSAQCFVDRFFRGDSTRCRRLIYRPGPADFRLPLSRGDACENKQHRQPQKTS